MKVLVATRSAHKLREIRSILRALDGLTLLDLNDAGIARSEAEDEIEVFDTFAENAVAKARYFQRMSAMITLADDSGLEVDALDGRPGVHSKRFAPGAAEFSDEERDRANNEHLLRSLGDLDLAQRTARYVCVAALDRGKGDPILCRGEAEGLILGHPRGTGGFGYDPLVFDPRTGRTFGELSPQEKEERSHRGAAFRAMAAELEPLRTMVP